MPFEPDRFAFSFTTAHILDSTGNAYDAANSNERIQSGDILIIPSEQVVAVANAWPLAVTDNYGKLHAYSGSADDIDKTCADLGFTRCDLKAAIKLADQMTFEIAPHFRHIFDEL